MKNQEKNNLGQLTKGRNYWGKGQAIKGQIQYHPYTRKDFICTDDRGNEIKIQ